MADLRKGKIPAVKIEPGKDNQIILRIFYNQISTKNLSAIKNLLDSLLAGDRT